MSDLINTVESVSTLSMSSREIAELTGKQHQHVRRDIESMLKFIEEDESKFGRIYLDSMNREQKEYQLPKNLTLNLVTGYRADLRLKIIDRWIELESSPVQPADLSRMDILQLAIEAEKENLQLKSENAELKPKADALERISEADGSLCITDAAKDLQMRPKDLFNMLSAARWIYRRLGTPWVGYQDKVQSGYLEHKITTIPKQDGSEKASTQVRITPKGLAKLSQQLSAQEMH